MDFVSAYREAQTKEREIREDSYFPCYVIGGVSMRPMNLLDFDLLARNGYFAGSPTKYDLFNLLWNQSLNKTPYKAAGLFTAIKRIFHQTIFARKSDEWFLKADAEMKDYIDAMILDIPRGDSDDTDYKTIFISSVVHRLASKYGWSERIILKLPLPRIFLYLREIKYEEQLHYRGEITPDLTRCDRVKIEWLKMINGGKD